MAYRIIILETLMLVTVVGCFNSSSTRSMTLAPDAWQSMLTSEKVQGSGIALDDLRPSGTVGADACIQCHAAQHASYLATTHSQSLRLIADGKMDEPLADFEHTGSKRRYQVEISGNRMIHREFIHGMKGETIAVNEAEITHKIGSGEHALSYLFERDGFLLESPLTLYAGAGWELSPGYDPTSHATFDRIVTANCVFCHVGAVRTHGNYLERFAITKLAIGCERCHGPGSNHVAFHSTKLDGKQGSTIDAMVNPARLSRTLGEAVCAQCHMQGYVAAGSAGANRWDYRPGEPLSDIVTEYQLQGINSEFRIVGHTEQMRDSRCYQNTDTLTCTTCHDPHSHADKASLTVRQRDTCIQCHENDGCRVPIATRVATQQDRCVICHMPRRDTNVPHAALHDHRIAVHPQSYRLGSLSVPAHVAASETSPKERPLLVPIVEDTELPIWQQQRRQALAIHSLAFGDRLPAQMRPELAQAQRTLLDLHRNGYVDANLEVSLSKDYLATNQIQPARELAQHAVETSVAGDVGYIGAADVLAQIALRDQDNASAIQWYHQLTQYRRVAGDYVMLAFCENNAGNRAAAISALEIALRIDPTLQFAHELMASILDADGQKGRAASHLEALGAIRAAGALLPGNSE